MTDTHVDSSEHYTFATLLSTYAADDRTITVRTTDGSDTTGVIGAHYSGSLEHFQTGILTIHAADGVRHFIPLTQITRITDNADKETKPAKIHSAANRTLPRRLR